MEPVDFVHILDDRNMGGVVRAFENFSHPSLSRLGRHTLVTTRDVLRRNHFRKRVAIVHSTANWSKLPLLIKMRLAGGYHNRVLVEHSYTDGFEQACVTHRRRFRTMLRLAYSQFDWIVAVSDSQKQWMVDAALAPEAKIVAIPQSRDCKALADLPLAKRGDGPLRIGAYGRYHRQKGFDLLILAVANLSPNLVRLEIAGAGEQDAGLRRLANDLPHISFQPAFDSPKAFLAANDVIALPSRWEAFGLVGAESRMAGRPLIAASIDGLRDQIGCHGWRHRVNDVEDLRRAIQAAAKCDSLHVRAAQARRHVRREYPQMIAKWAGLMESVSA